MACRTTQRSTWVSQEQRGEEEIMRQSNFEVGVLEKDSGIVDKWGHKELDTTERLN